MTTREIWNSYSSDLKQFIISKVRNEALADDILQDTFIKIHMNLGTVKDLSKIKAWVFQIGRNTTLDFFKKNQATFDFEVAIPLEESTEATHSELDCLQGILSNLPKKYRTPIFLSDVKGLKQKEVAAQLRLPLPTVKSQIQRGRKLIAEGFMDCCGYVMNDEGKLIGEIQAKEDCKVCN